MKNLIVRRTHEGQRWVEERSGLLFGIYRWRGGPRFHLIIGRSNKADTVLEIGVLGRTFWVAPRPE